MRRGASRPGAASGRPPAAEPDGWLSPWFGRLLVEHGHLDTVRRLAGDRDGYCALVLAEEAAQQGDVDAALAAAAPLLAAGWWDAVQTVACLLSEAGRLDEALALCGPIDAETDRATVRLAVDLLVDHGRREEAFALVRPRVDQPGFAAALVEVSAGLGRDDEVLSVLDAIAGAGAEREARGRYPTGRGGTNLVATVLDRAGRVDEAVRLLRAETHRDGSTHVNVVIQLADLLARRGRHDDLRALIDGRGAEYAAYPYALHLERTGDVDAAVALLAPGAADGHRTYSTHLAEILNRAGRRDEALAVLSRAMPHDIECLLRWWREEMVGHGRAAEALAVVEELMRAPDAWLEPLVRERLVLLVLCDRAGEALAEVTAARDRGEGDEADEVAWALAETGRTEDALAVLRSGPDPEPHANQAAALLVRLGRIDEALATVPRDRTRNGFVPRRYRQQEPAAPGS